MYLHGNLCFCCWGYESFFGLVPSKIPRLASNWKLIGVPCPVSHTLKQAIWYIICVHTWTLPDSSFFFLPRVLPSSVCSDRLKCQQELHGPKHCLSASTSTPEAVYIGQAYVLVSVHHDQIICSAGSLIKPHPCHCNFQVIMLRLFLF